MNVTSQRAFRPAAMLRRAHSPLTSVLRPPWLRVRDTFAICVAVPAAINRFTPPLPICPLTPDVLGGKAIRGNISSESQPKTRVPCTRVFSFASWHALAFASPRLPRGFSRCITRCNAYQRCSGENSLPTRVLRGRITVGARPRLPCFSPRTLPSSFSIRKRHSNETRDSAAVVPVVSRPGGLSYHSDETTDSTAVPPLFSLLISWVNFSLFRRGGPLFTLFSMEEMLL